MNIGELIYYSGLNNFLYTKNNLVNGYEYKGKAFIIALNLNMKEISYIKNNFDKFKDILENILYTFNQSSDKYFGNVTFTSVKIGDNLINNCIFLYNDENNEYGFIEINSIIKFNKGYSKQKDIYDKIYDLAMDNNLSVRNIIKLGISQTKARKIYSFLKEKEVIIISKYNNNSKRYNLEKLKKIIEIVRKSKTV